MTSTDLYILRRGKPVAEPDAVKWALWFDGANRIVASSHPIRGVHVSTVFLGLDHNFAPDGPPLLYETMIFGGPEDGYQRRYATVSEARKGHRSAIRLAKSAQKRLGSEASA